jgi:hypothetical protein
MWLAMLLIREMEDEVGDVDENEDEGGEVVAERFEGGMTNVG